MCIIKRLKRSSFQFLSGENGAASRDDRRSMRRSPWTVAFPGNAFIGGCQKLPHRISLSGALSAGEREAWSPALVGAVQVW